MEPVVIIVIIMVLLGIMPLFTLFCIGIVDLLESSRRIKQNEEEIHEMINRM